MSLIENTWDLVEQFTVAPVHVNINESNIENLAGEVKKHIADSKEFFIGKPRCIEELKADWDRKRYHEEYEIIAYELLLDSANYNYWYGRGDVRPNGASSYEMSKLLDSAFYSGHLLSSIGTPHTCSMAASAFKRELILHRYPNLENRLKHIEEVKKLFSRHSHFLDSLVYAVQNGKEDAEYVIECLITECPGFASDMFLKRAFLFIIEMNRRMGWFKKDIHKIPIPADYQIPKMLCYYGILTHDNDLKRMIGSHSLIQSGSLMECEIRASAMKACKMVAEEAGVTMADVDTFLFANRKDSVAPFHLTITTDY